MAQPLIIIGTGNNTLDILDIVEAVNRETRVWEVLGCLDDARPVGSRSDGTEILAGVRDAARYAGCMFVNAIGSDRSYRKRPDVVAQTRLPPERFAVLIHPLAAVSSRANVGPGSCVNAGVVVAGGVRIGAHVWLEAGCVVGPNAVVEDHAVIASGAVLGASARIGSAAYIGLGACVRRRVTVGEQSLIGIGGVVINNVPKNVTVIGNPARIMVKSNRQTDRSQDSRPNPSDTESAQPGRSDPSSQSSNQ